MFTWLRAFRSGLDYLGDGIYVIYETSSNMAVELRKY